MVPLNRYERVLMKKMILSLLAFHSFSVLSEMVTQKELESAKVVRYSITIYRDDQTNNDAWKKVIDQTSDIIKLGSVEGNDQEFIDHITKSLSAIPTRLLDNGIHGEIKVGIGDGVCACNAPCDCAKQYKGLCPCSALRTSDCKK